MGQVHFGVPGGLVDHVRASTGIRVAVETGTFRGASTVVLARAFPTVVSCEADPRCLALAAATLRAAGCAERVRLVQGGSAECLAGMLERIDEPALFWLDAHWSPWMPVGCEPQCPVRDELTAIAGWAHAADSVILVDDASVFRDRPDDAGFRPGDWPTYTELVDLLAGVAGHRIRLTEDVLVAGPLRLGTVGRPALDPDGAVTAVP
ncbi:methyltransferase family protein [Pseudonocardia sediminis]|uniref:Methyltransferase family protein n=1 Tax=Pseudonocardia sediminis TaxID=1397368 RepID=A0A4Q7UYP3_PSEST|nr:class I SAM-dependent methyltransferase [Pseudonocardia sediminis]RZT86925.1 methyltransferase family protein [Pseudonocardia sediminis]